MKKSLIAAALAIVPLCVQAQRIYVDGFIYDSFTGEKLDSVNVVFMRPDSTVTERFISKKFGWWQFSENLKAPGKYIIRFSKKGYETTYKNVNFKYRKNRVTGGTFGEVLMRKKSTARNRVLPEAVVQATKIKMVMKGDTIVYNADAFQLRTGSMLDKLIQMLPGVELRRGGEIFVHGRKVQSLLVNGEDFFRGDPTVALQNLPAYMVDKVKVYERTPDRLLALGIDPETFRRSTFPLVVDVNLKKEYSMGWIANATVGGGTGKHYNARAFALRFSPQVRWAFIGFTNDVYANSYYDANGNWQTPGEGDDVQSHELSTDLLVNDKRKRYKIQNTLTYHVSRQRNETLQSSTAYYGTGNVYGTSHNVGTDRNWRIHNYGTITVTPRKRGMRFSPMNTSGFTMELNPNIRFYNYDNRSGLRSADYSRELTDHYRGETLDSLFFDGSSALYRQNLLRSLRQNRRSEGYQLTTFLSAKGSWRPKGTADQLDFDLGGQYLQTRDRYLFGAEAYDGSNRQQRFTHTPTQGYDYHGGASYMFALTTNRFNFYVAPEYRYDRQYRSADQTYYHLENTPAEDWSTERLASTKDALTDYIDLSNSQYTDRWNQTHHAAATFSLLLKDEDDPARYNTFTLTLPLRAVSNKVDYLRGQIDTVLTKRYRFFEPSAEYAFDLSGQNPVEYHVRVGYNATQTAPSVTSLLNYRDDATPYVVRLGNPALQPTRLHTARASVTRNVTKRDSKRDSYLSAQVQYNRWQHAQAQAVTYDEATGVTTYRPVNIEGNWGTSAQLRWNGTVNPKKTIYFTTVTSHNFRHSEDFATFAGEAASSRIRVDRHVTRQEFSANYARNYYSWRASVNAQWTHARSNRYAKLDALNISYDLQGGIPLPGDLQLNTRLTLYSRYGYQNDRFNTSQLIWSANLSRSFLNGLMDVRLEAFDLLNKMSNYSYAVDAQMQTETYRNVLRRYVMLNLTFRLNREPKKH